MTRFARAAGSKSCNARVPEDATSWAEMKQQLETKRHQEHEENVTAMEQLSGELIAESHKRKKLQKSSTDTKWAEFEEIQPQKRIKLRAESCWKMEQGPTNVDAVKLKKKKRSCTDNQNAERSEDERINTPCAPRKKKKEGKNGRGMEEIEPQVNSTIAALNQKKGKSLKEPPMEKMSDLEADNKSKSKKKKKNEKINLDYAPTEDSRRENAHRLEKKTFLPRGGPGKKQFNKKLGNASEGNFTSGKKERKLKGRRKPKQEFIMVEGRKIEIEDFDNFPVKKEDAIRLRELKKEMLNKGIPKEEVFKAMKLERRRAEKALSRERRKLCFHCRGSGHMVSDCPKLAEGTCSICFKCGSTEHMSSQCRVSGNNEYRFGSCFVCGEQGHIARQCPDNPRGLYPQGGSCRVCGDVTHLKKDCPKLAEEKRDNAITLSTIQAAPLEALDTVTTLKTETPKAKNKIIKF